MDVKPSDPRDASYNAFRRYELTWSPYFHYGLFGDATDLEAAQELALDTFGSLGCVDADTHLLDVGCGIASSAIYMARKFRCHVLGIDPIASQIDYGRYKVQIAGLDELIKLETGKAEAIPAAAENFDAILMNEVLCLIKDKSSALKEARRVLKRQGQLVISDLYDCVGGAATEPFHKAMRHCTPLLQPEQMLALIKAAGFEACEFFDKKIDVCKSYAAAIARLASKEAEIAAAFGRDEYKATKVFYQYCLSHPIRDGIGWAIYRAR